MTTHVSRWLHYILLPWTTDDWTTWHEGRWLHQNPFLLPTNFPWILCVNLWTRFNQELNQDSISTRKHTALLHSNKTSKFSCEIKTETINNKRIYSGSIQLESTSTWKVNSSFIRLKWDTKSGLNWMWKNESDQVFIWLIQDHLLN